MSMSSSFNAAMARGVSPSPQTLSRPNGPFSNTTTRNPARAARSAVAAPPGPPPMTAMSQVSMGSSLPETGRETETWALCHLPQLPGHRAQPWKRPGSI